MKCRTSSDLRKVYIMYTPSQQISYQIHKYLTRFMGWVQVNHSQTTISKIYRVSTTQPLTDKCLNRFLGWVHLNHSKTNIATDVWGEYNSTIHRQWSQHIYEVSTTQPSTYLGSEYNLTIYRQQSLEDILL